MLAVDADILFIVDESTSDESSTVQSWLASMASELQSELGSNNVNARYGLIGLGEFTNNGTPNDPNDDFFRYAHSQLLDDVLFSDDYNALIDAFDNLMSTGGDEDGWDAFEHAIAEYEFRPGAVPIVVLVQNDEGRIDHVGNDLSSTTREGILATLQSKNVIVNSMVVGETIDNEPVFDWLPLFDLSPYEATAGAFDDIRILGVEADLTDSIPDGQHTYYGFDTDNHIAATGGETIVDALQVSYNGSNTGATGMVASGKSVLIAENITGGTGGGASETPDCSILVLLALVGVFAPDRVQTRASLGRNCYNRRGIFLTDPPPS